jgi:uncharacterized membrane protein
MIASDFRRIARGALRGKWMLAVFAGLIATLLGAVGSDGPEFNVNVEGGSAKATRDLAGMTIFSTGGSLDSNIGAFLAGFAGMAVLVSLFLLVFHLIIGSVVGVGYARFNLNLVDGREAGFNDLFSAFPIWKTALIAGLLQTLYIFLWTLLFIIPGVMAGYSYRLTSYLLTERPELRAGEAIALSKQLMSGNRWRLFCLDFSFIGWSILCTLTLGIGSLWLVPYKQAAYAAFYRDVTMPAPQLEL